MPGRLTSTYAGHTKRRRQRHDIARMQPSQSWMTLFPLEELLVVFTKRSLGLRLWADGLFQRLADNAMDVIACINDLFSIRKDSRDGNGPGNMVLILVGLRQLSLQDATDEARKMIRNALKEFQRSEPEFLGSTGYGTVATGEDYPAPYCDYGGLDE
ncbi:hypothetical protein N7467_001499 [Penicillium canescens]|nr:hypothetical protein N7467_001499 [Penicillium canescens]